MIDWEFLHEALCPAGNGVYAVTTGKNYKQPLQKLLYSNNSIESSWQHQLRMLSDDKPCLWAIPSDTGGGILRGANWGPLIMREALYQRLDKNQIHDLGDVRVIPQLLLDEYITPDLKKNCQQALFSQPKPDWPVSPLSIAKRVCDNLYQNHPQIKLITLGGDHSVSYPLVLSFLQAKKQQGINTAVIHFDAHTDLLKERLGIPINFATWVSHVLPEMSHPDCWIQLGIRASGKDKNHWHNQFGIQQYWARDIHEIGMKKISEMIIDHFTMRQIEEIYLTFDVDALDADIASQTGTPEPDGLDTKDCLSFIKSLCQNFKLGAADLVEVAPFSHAHASACKSGKTIDAACDILINLIQA